MELEDAIAEDVEADEMSGAEEIPLAAEEEPDDDAATFELERVLDDAALMDDETAVLDVEPSAVDEDDWASDELDIRVPEGERLIEEAADNEEAEDRSVDDDDTLELCSTAEENELTKEELNPAEEELEMTEEDKTDDEADVVRRRGKVWAARVAGEGSV